MLQRLFPWAMRASWAALPLAMGPSMAAALDPRSRAVQLVSAVLLWGGWAAALAASLVPSPIGLTVLRVAAPGAPAVAFAAAAAGHGSPPAVGFASVALALALLPDTAQHFVNAVAYPNERRFPLRTPAPLLLGVAPLAWALCVGPPVAAALLLASRQWVAGAVVAVVAAPLAVLLARALHGLSRRWLVFVPAGVVVHDPIGLADPVLFARRVIAAFGPAEVGTDALDLTQRAPGLALQLTLREEVPLIRTTPGRRGGQPASPTS
ncbi:MAG: hypothetical protein ABIW46_03760, partial [Acidimicrobiales bacterium]